jgi:hypothetical protein
MFGGSLYEIVINIVMYITSVFSDVEGISGD